MAKTGQNFIHFKSRFRQVVFFIEDVDTLTGFKAYWGMAENETSAPLVSKSSEGVAPGIELSGQDVIVTLDPADTTSLVPAKYYHELKLIDINENPLTPAIGEVDLRPVTL